MYPEQLVNPMKAEMTQVGFEELTSADAVEKTLNPTSGTVLVFINSVCGCAAGAARPGVKLSLENEKKPTKLTTVFAGFDTEAVASARNFMLPYPPSSPAIALFKDGKLVSMVERHQIEGSPAQVIAQHLISLFNEHCN